MYEVIFFACCGNKEAMIFLPSSLIDKILARLSFGSQSEWIKPSRFRFLTTTVILPGVLVVSFVIEVMFKSPL